MDPVAQALSPVRFLQSSLAAQLACSQASQPSKAHRQECLRYSIACDWMTLLQRVNTDRVRQEDRSFYKWPALGYVHNVVTIDVTIQH
jgi:hypothetical protein